MTGDFPDYHLGDLYKKVRDQCPDNEDIQNMTVPEKIGGSVSLILGIKYQSIFPEPVHYFDNGMVISKSKLMPAWPGATAVISGPIELIDNMTCSLGDSTALSYLVNLLKDGENNLTRVDYFPSHNTFN